MANWHYYNENGEKIGPIRGRDLKQLAQQGTVTPNTRVEDENGRTALAKNVTGLPFYEAKRSGIAPPKVAQPEKAPSEPSSVMLPPSAEVNPFVVPIPTVNQTAPQSVPVPHAESTGKSSWIITVIGIFAIVCVGGIGWTIITSHQPEQASNARVPEKNNTQTPNTSTPPETPHDPEGHNVSQPTLGWGSGGGGM